MKYFLSEDSVLKWLEKPSVYNMRKDDLYELDDKSFEFLKNCSSNTGCESEYSEFIDYCTEEGLLTGKQIRLKRPTLIQSHIPSLRYLELQVTDKCNLRCKHCYIGDNNRIILPKPLPSREGKSRENPIKGKSLAEHSIEGWKVINNSPLPWRERVSVRGKNINELSLSQIRNILREFENMQGLRVLITGGEPLLHSNFAEINEMFPDFFLRKVLFTNGVLMNNRILKKLNVHEIQVSIDGMEVAHDSLRGKGTFRSAINAVKRAIEFGFDVSISTMVHSKNYGDFDEMETLFKNLGIKDWTVDIPCIAGRLKDNIEFQVTPEQGGEFFKYGYGGGFHSSASGFACGLHLIAVLADGSVSKCSFYSDRSVGTVDDGLRNCWGKIQPIRLDELKCECDFLELCRGGCRYRAELLGDPMGRDLYKCYYYGKIN